jgi:superfamily II DNA/RNA helicase
MNQALVFTATKRDADALADKLSAQGLSVAALHGDMNQRERNRTLLNMRNGNVRILVATDVAARGLDVRGISHVINFDLPKFAEDYVHRIGRTGRGGSSGIAISFASNRDAQMLKRIERYTEQSIKMHTIEGLEPKYKLRTGGPSSDRPRSNSGPRRSSSGGYGGGNNAGFGGNRTGGYAGNKTGGGFAGKTGNGFHHSAPDSRHSHAGRPKEGHGQWHGQTNGNTSNGHTLGVGGGQGFGGQGRSQGAGQPRSQERSFGNNRGGNSAPRRTGDRPSYTLGRGNNGNSR